MITVFPDEPFIMIRDDIDPPETAPATYKDSEGVEHTAKHIYLKIVRPQRGHDEFEESRDDEFPNVDSAEAYMISRIIQELKSEPVFPGGFKHFGFSDIKPDQYIYRINQAYVYIAKASKRGMGNLVICNPRMKDFFTGAGAKPVIELTNAVPDKMALVCYKGHAPIDFPIGYSETTKKLYIYKKYLDYFTLIDLNA